MPLEIELVLLGASGSIEVLLVSRSLSCQAAEVSKILHVFKQSEKELVQNKFKFDRNMALQVDCPDECHDDVQAQ